MIKYLGKRYYNIWFVKRVVYKIWYEVIVFWGEKNIKFGRNGFKYGFFNFFIINKISY